ncbi:hypothetical protein ACE1TI_12695 [Alteribacillus sp. JSM 102045]|uniref:hypothetical protein n=1 Tax=Alteribacillus sp. JSM 102045 TaxID=1562101 RepID=UPI0035C13361
MINASESDVRSTKINDIETKLKMLSNEELSHIEHVMAALEHSRKIFRENF